MHVQDNFGTADHYIFPFCGTTNFGSLINGLLEIGYNGYFTFEATSLLKRAAQRRVYEKDTFLSMSPVELRCEAEKLLYKIGECFN